MRTILLLLIFLSTVLVCKAQYKNQTVLKDQQFYLNSATNIGGKTRVILPVSLPANTIAWCYTYSANRDKASAVAVSDRLTHIADLTAALAEIPPGSIAAVQQLVKSLSAPPGGDACDIYLMNRQGYDHFMQVDGLGQWAFPKPAHYLEGSRENFKSGCVPVCAQELQNGQFFIGIRNPDKLHGINIVLSVEAVVAEQPMTTVANGVQLAQPVGSMSTYLVGKWKDNNSTLILNSDGTIYINFDGYTTWAKGQWSTQGSTLYTIIDGNTVTYSVLSLKSNEFIYQAIQSSMVYTATRINN